MLPSTRLQLKPQMVRVCFRLFPVAGCARAALITTISDSSALLLVLLASQAMSVPPPPDLDLTVSGGNVDRAPATFASAEGNPGVGEPFRLLDEPRLLLEDEVGDDGLYALLAEGEGDHDGELAGADAGYPSPSLDMSEREWYSHAGSFQDGLRFSQEQPSAAPPCWGSPRLQSAGCGRSGR